MEKIIFGIMGHRRNGSRCHWSMFLKTKTLSEHIFSCEINLLTKIFRTFERFGHVNAGFLYYTAYVVALNIPLMIVIVVTLMTML